MSDTPKTDAAEELLYSLSWDTDEDGFDREQFDPVSAVRSEKVRELERENAALRRDVYQCPPTSENSYEGFKWRDACEELEREVAELRQKFATMPDNVWSKADLVKQVHQALAERDDADRKNLALRNEIARLNGQTVWVCACGGTDCAGQKENAALKIERNRLRRALLDCSDAAVGGSTLATWIRGKVAATLGKETRP